MQRQPVRSSHIKSIGYSPSQQMLEVEFKDGKVYQYYGVPKKEYIAMMEAWSHGRYLEKHIKPKYRYARVKQ